jgi:hypothetical protein
MTFSALREHIPVPTNLTGSNVSRACFFQCSAGAHPCSNYKIIFFENVTDLFQCSVGAHPCSNLLARIFRRIVLFVLSVLCWSTSLFQRQAVFGGGNWSPLSVLCWSTSLFQHEQETVTEEEENLSVLCWSTSLFQPSLLFKK